MKRTCQMTMEDVGVVDTYFPCGKPAKYVAPPDKMNPRKMFVCGIHKNSIDKMYIRVGSDKRCKALAAPNTEPEGESE